MENKVQILNNTRTPYTVRQTTLNGVEYVVVPVVMMVEGVHSGSKGAILHTADALSALPDKWNDTPVTIQHPQDGDNFISANTEGVDIVGRVQNTVWENGKLKADVYLERQKIQPNRNLFNSIMNNRPMDVSIGAFTTERQESGVWGDEQYIGVAVDYIPDHLALLPGEQGACGWQDGCGIRANQLNNNKQEENQMITKKQLQDYADSMGVVLTMALQTNEEGMQSKVNKIRQLVDSMDSEQSMHYLMEVYEDSFIYRKEIRPINGRQREERFYQQKYQWNEEINMPEMVDDPIKVIHKVEYIPMTANKEQKPNNLNNNNMKKEKTAPCPDKVTALIANQNSAFQEEDREFLMTLSAEQVEKLEPKTINVVEQAKPITDADVATYLQTKTTAEVLSVLPAEMKEEYSTMLAQKEARREFLITEIMANTDKVWEKEHLQAMNCNILAKIHETVVKTKGATYVANGNNGNGGQNPAKQDNDMLLPIGIKKS